MKMKKLTVLTVAIFGVCAFYFGAQVWANSAEEAAARVPLENYLKAHATGDGEYIRKAFLPEGKMTFVREGKVNVVTGEEFAARFNGKPAPDEAQRKRWIDSLEVKGDVAIGRIILDYPNGKFTDYMTLLKLNGEWKIINKSFHLEPKAQTK
jgi:hypothetical protein